MSTTDEELARLHANVVKHRIEYPEAFRFPEEYELTQEDMHIPTERYTSPEVLREEMATTWMHTWQLVCREEEVALPGDYHEYRIGTQSFLVVRGEDGQLSAVQNTCLHRGKLIRTGTGNTDELRCGYHYWCWDLKGRLKEIPDRQLFPGVEDSQYRLAEVGCEVWAGFVFINPDPSGPSLHEYLGPVVEQLAPYRLEQLRATMHVAVELPCNWKVAVEAFVETYHVQGIHPQLMPYVDDVNTKFDLLGDHTRMIVPFGVPSMRIEHIDQGEIYESYYKVAGRVAVRDKGAPPPTPEELVLPPEFFDDNGEWISAGTVRDHLIEQTIERGRAMGHDHSGLDRAQLVDDYHYHIFPSMYFNLHAGAMLLFRSRPHATDPNRSVFDVWTLRTPDLTQPLPEPAKEMQVDLATTSFGLVLDQDFDNLGEVQAGLHARSVDHITVGAAEIRVINMHRTLRRYAEKYRADV